MNFGPPSGPPPGHGPPPHGPSGHGPPPGQGGYGQGGMPVAWNGPPNPMAGATMGSPSPGPGGPHHPMNPGPPMNTGAVIAVDTTGSYEGLQFRIDHRDSNSVLRLTLQPGYMVKGKSGSMVCMAGTVAIKGSMKVSLTKLMLGGEMTESQFTGPGEVVLAPEIWGDIVPITIQPNVSWSVGKDAYLACTSNVVRSTKSQGFMKGLMSGEGFFVAKIQGQGILFVQSLGAIIKRDLMPGEEWIVDNGHLVAWSASYSMERIAAGGGMFGASATGEGAVCRFKGPGTVYIQTRNPQSLGAWVAAQVPAG